MYICVYCFGKRAETRHGPGLEAPVQASSLAHHRREVGVVSRHGKVDQSYLAIGLSYCSVDIQMLFIHDRDVQSYFWPKLFAHGPILLL